jgi:hypothetical protein
MKLSIGTTVEACGKKFVVVACGNGRYTVSINGSRWTMPCSEAHDDIKSGKAIIVLGGAK